MKEQCLQKLQEYYSGRLAQNYIVLFELHNEIKQCQQSKPDKKIEIKNIKHEIKHNKKLSKSYHACLHVIEMLHEVN